MRADLGGEVYVVVVDEVCVVREPAQPEHDQHHDEHHAHLQQYTLLHSTLLQWLVVCPEK